MQNSYDSWLDEVKGVLRAINMPLDEWQKIWKFDFAGEYSMGAEPRQAAAKANRFWWRQQNLSLQQECLLTPDCWLPQGHQGECEPIS